MEPCMPKNQISTHFRAASAKRDLLTCISTAFLLLEGDDNPGLKKTVRAFEEVSAACYILEKQCLYGPAEPPLSPKAALTQARAENPVRPDVDEDRIQMEATLIAIEACSLLDIMLNVNQEKDRLILRDMDARQALRLCQHAKQLITRAMLLELHLTIAPRTKHAPGINPGQ